MAEANLKYKTDYVARIVDELGEVAAQRKEAQKREDVLKKELRQMRDDEGATSHFVGNDYEAHLSLGSRRSLPKDVVTRHLGEKWVAEHEVETEYVKIDVHPIGK